MTNELPDTGVCTPEMDKIFDQIETTDEFNK